MNIFKRNLRGHSHGHSHSYYSTRSGDNDKDNLPIPGKLSTEEYGNIERNFIKNTVFYNDYYIPMFINYKIIEDIYYNSDVDNYYTDGFILPTIENTNYKVINCMLNSSYIDPRIIIINNTVNYNYVSNIIDCELFDNSYIIYYELIIIVAILYMIWVCCNCRFTMRSNNLL